MRDEKFRLHYGTHSLQTKLAGLLSGMFLIILVINLFIYSQINMMVRQIDQVFASNVSIEQLKDGLKEVEDNVYEYLSTKSSEALENYYRCAEEYQSLTDDLNGTIVDSPIKMLEKNIREMSVTYLEKADETVQAKRGRNVERYKASYEELSRLYGYISNYIYQLNSTQFTQNSENYKFLLHAMSVLEIFSLAIVVIVFGICLAVALSLIRSMFKPLTLLSGTAREVAAGNFDVEPPVPASQDEVGVVTATFAQMLGSIRAYIDQLRDSMETEARMKERELSMEAHLKEAQLRFLQAQINPHFLFNSLNAGAQLAVMEDADATGIFLERMADFFRYNVKKTDGSSTLAEEVALVDNYIYILNVRFAGDITYIKQIEADIDSVEMPSMILQPLVENAVSHGIHDMMDRGIITLRIEQCREGLRIIVRDNGKGMSQRQIADIYAGKTQEEGESTGIGLRNVISRLELFYERTDLLEIDSEGEGMGTQIALLIPLTKEDEGV